MIAIDVLAVVLDAVRRTRRPTATGKGSDGAAAARAAREAVARLLGRD
jgi:hypothetical protein